MAEAMIVGAVVEDAVSRLSGAITHVIENTWQFRSKLAAIRETIITFKPILNDIGKLNGEFDVPKQETDMLMAQLKSAESIVLKCTRIRWNIYSRYRLLLKLDKLNASLLKSLQLDVSLQGGRDVRKLLLMVKDLQTRMDDMSSGVVVRFDDSSASPSGSDRLGVGMSSVPHPNLSDGDGESSRVAVDPLSTSESLRGGFKSWQKGDFLGSGSFGIVYEGFNELGNFFAVKEVSLLDSGGHGKKCIIQLQQEISLLSRFHHENIVRYLGTDKDDGKLYIFLELVTKGSLAKLYQKYELRDSQVSVYTRQILSGLIYLHEQNVVHRDIKCANILVDATGSVKLADFGLAKATTLSGIKSCKGSPYWMAPEVIHSSSKKGYGLAADIWSLGCTVLEMLTRKIPYFHLEGVAAMFRIATGELPSIPDTLSTEARDFILKCLQFNPNDRPTAAQLLDHPFIRRRTSMNLSPASPNYNATQVSEAFDNVP